MRESEAIELVHDFLNGRTGSFFSQLIGAMFHADGRNTRRLLKAYPQLMDCVNRYKTESGYAQEHGLDKSAGKFIRRAIGDPDPQYTGPVGPPESDLTTVAAVA